MLLSAGILKPGAGAMTIEYLVSATVIISFLLNLVSINQFAYNMLIMNVYNSDSVGKLPHKE